MKDRIPGEGGDEPEPTEDPFTALEAPQTGEFVFSMMKGETRYYASSLELDGSDKVSGYIQTSTDPTKAVKFEIVSTEGGYHIKMGDKYLEINPYEGKDKTSYKLKLVDAPSAVWEWQATEKLFAQKATQIVETEPATNYFYIGTYSDSKYTTMSPSDIKFIRDDNASKLDVSQFPARFGTVDLTDVGGGDDGGDTEPEVNHGSEETPLTVAEFFALSDLPTGDYSTFDVWVKGYVVKSVEGPSKGEYNLYISDEKGNAGTTLQIFWAACDEQPFIGDFIVANGYIKKYSSTFELSKRNGNANNTNVITIKERATDTVTVEIIENENATLSADKQSGTNGQQIVITATPNQGYDFVKLTVEGVEITAKDSDEHYLAYIGDYNGDQKVTIEITVQLHVDKTYTLVENVSQLTAGTKVVLAYVNGADTDKKSVWLAGEMGSNKYFTALKDAATLGADGKTLTNVSTQAVEFTIGISETHYTFSIGDTLIGLTKSTDNNTLATTGNSLITTWDITITDGVAAIVSTSEGALVNNKPGQCKLQCNTATNQERFSNYKTGSQKDCQLFIVTEVE